MSYLFLSLVGKAGAYPGVASFGLHSKGSHPSLTNKYWTRAKASIAKILNYQWEKFIALAAGIKVRN